MIMPSCFWRFCVLCTLLVTAYALSEGRGQASVPGITTRERVRLNNGRTDLVEWDGYSLFVHGQRIFLWSGELHTWRLPVPELWLDVLQKIKALGMNAISIYVHW